MGAITQKAAKFFADVNNTDEEAIVLSIFLLAKQIDIINEFKQDKPHIEHNKKPE